MHVKILPVLVACLLPLFLQAQNFSTADWWKPAGEPFSPVVRANKSVTFRMKATKANSVNLLFGEWAVKPQPMQKDSAGNWVITINNVAPGTYSYVFSVDGVPMPDLANPIIKRGTSLYGSIVEVPGEWKDVPHGVTHIHTLRTGRKFQVYVPAAYYTQNTKRFPLLVLRHGGGDNESSWLQESGKADIILDNLIAENKAVPMIIVLPYGLTDGSWAGGSSKEGVEQLEGELLKEIMPSVESQYRVAPGKQNRAIAGLSMGGGQAYIIGLRNLDKFSYVGEFSSGLLSDASFNINERVPGLFEKPATINQQLELLWIGCGTDDPRMPGHRNLHTFLEKNKVKHEDYTIPGGHEWKVWREQLYQFMQRLFK